MNPPLGRTLGLGLATSRSAGFFLVFPLALIALLAAGCAGTPRTERWSGFRGGVFAPTTPIFLSGPLALLLTNSDGFSTRVTCETKALGDKQEHLSGQLVGRGTKLIFSPDPADAENQRFHAAGLGFIWDVQSHTGFLLSDALQGYAPISSKVSVTNLVIQPGAAQSSPEKLDGHPCRQDLVTVAANDGSVASYQVWRAIDLKELPLRITSEPAPPRISLSLSRLRLESPPQDLFLPPVGFTKYESAETMMDELSARQQNLQRRGPVVPEVAPPLGQPEGRYGRGQ